MAETASPEKHDTGRFLRRLGTFLAAGLPGMALAVLLNYLLVTFARLHPALAYPVVLFVQLTVNFVMLRRFIFAADPDRGYWQSFGVFLAGAAFLRFLDWAIYTGWIWLGVHFIAAQLINVAVFLLIRFSYAKRVMEGRGKVG